MNVRKRLTFASMAATGLLLSACGNDGEGNNDSLLTGFSAVVIVAIVVVVIFVLLRRRR